MAKVSIITQAFNEEASIERCIRSVLEQTYQQFELVLIDNGSTDATGTIMENFAREDSRIKVLHNERNMSYVYWIKNLLSLVECEYFVSLDADDWLEPLFLEKCIETIEQENADVVCTLWFYEYGDGTAEKMGPFHEQITFSREKIPEYLGTLACLEHVWGKIFKRTILEGAVLPFMKEEYNFGADGILWWSYLRNCEKISFLPNYLHHYTVAKDISTSAYHKREPFIYHSVAAVLGLEYNLLKSVGIEANEAVGLILGEYFLKMSGCLETDLLESFPVVERTIRIAGLYAVDFHSMRSEIIRTCFPTFASLREVINSLIAENESLDYVNWLKSISQNEESIEAIIFSLLLIRYLLQKDRTNRKAQKGLQETIENLEQDRKKKDAALSEREGVIAELTRVREEKDAELSQREDIIAELTRVREEKDAELSQREDIIAELTRVREEKDAELSQREDIIAELTRVREEKDAELSQREDIIAELTRVREEKDAELSQREDIIAELTRIREEKDAELSQREGIIAELTRVREEKDAELSRREGIIAELIRVRDEKDDELAKREKEIQCLRGM